MVPVWKVKRKKLWQLYLAWREPDKAVLADPEKRARYDRFGHDGLSMSQGFDPSTFSDFEDLFGGLFGELFGFDRRPGGVDGEPAVRLCNYSDVYNNELITEHIDFMACTATEDEIRKFGLLVDDVIITKDSESWDDIGIPALVVETADDLVCGYHLALLRPHETALSGRFLLRCLQAKVL